MARETKDGLTEVSMMVIGWLEKLREKENLDTQTVMFMKVNGRTTKLMDKEHTLMLMVHNTLASGRKINNMATGKKPGLMVPSIKENT